MAEDHTDRRGSGSRPRQFSGDAPLVSGDAPLVSGDAPLGRQPGPGWRPSGEPLTLDAYGVVSPFGSVEFSLSDPPRSYRRRDPAESPDPDQAADRYAPADPGPRRNRSLPPDLREAPDSRWRAEPGWDDKQQWAGERDWEGEPGWWSPDGRRRVPAPGWRRAIFHATGGLVRVPSPAAERRRRELIGRVRAPVLSGHHRVVVLSLKGGVGKTTTTVGIGSVLASLRGERIIAVDASPDRGTLSDKVTLETAATVRDLLSERDQIRGYADMRAFTSQSPSKLEVLASDQDPAVSVPFDAGDYTAVCQILERYYSVCLTDCGTGLLHSAMAEVLRLADQIVLASTAAVDSARCADSTLDWLTAHDHGHLARDAVVVLSAVRPRSRSTVSLDLLDEHFSARCRAVATIPYDVHLDEGAEMELGQLSGGTIDAFLELAVLVAGRFATARGQSPLWQPPGNRDERW